MCGEKKMRKLRTTAVTITAILILSMPAGFAMQRIDTSHVDGIRIDSPSRVQAGKPFQVQLTSRRSKFQSGICWMDSGAKGFNFPNYFKMSGGKASVKITPVATGTGILPFSCGTDRSDSRISSYIQIYIAP
jgi:hypothetical protein